MQGGLAERDGAAQRLLHASVHIWALTRAVGLPTPNTALRGHANEATSACSPSTLLAGRGLFMQGKRHSGLLDPPFSAFGLACLLGTHGGSDLPLATLGLVLTSCVAVCCCRHALPNAEAWRSPSSPCLLPCHRPHTSALSHLPSSSLLLQPAHGHRPDRLLPCPSASLRVAAPVCLGAALDLAASPCVVV